MRKIGVLYLDGEHFKDDANQTIGKPALTPDVIGNRRAVSARVNELGILVKSKAKLFFKEKYDFDIDLKWSKKAGCSMCPCSPGFNISIPNNQLEGQHYAKRVSEDDQINIWGNKGEVQVNYPKYGFLQEKNND